MEDRPIAQAMQGAVLSLLLLAAAGGPAQARTRAARSPAVAPVVVELYTAQGCAACPESNKRMGGLALRSELLPLTFSVDYWDYLGWKDTFADPAFAERQKAYVGRMKVREIYTPEVVVDGRSEAPGVAPDKVDALVEEAVKARAAAGAPSPRITLLRRGTRVRVGGGPASGGTYDVWLIRYDPRERVVKVKGDDRKTIPVSHFNEVREIARLGVWRGRERTFTLAPAETPGLKTVVLVQGVRGGRIVVAARLG